MANYTTTTLITKVKRWGSIPTTQALFQDSDFISMLDEELQYAITPMVHSVREEFFMRKYTTAIVSGTKEYLIPTRSIGGVIKDVFLENSAGDQRVIRKIDSHNKNEYTNGYYMQGNKIVLIDESPFIGYNLAVYYPMRPNNLVAVLDVAQISSIASNVVTVGSRPSAWTNADTFDLVQNNYPFESLAIDQVVSISGNDITFSSVPSNLAVGDWVCLAGESPIPQIPVEVINILCQGVVVKCLEAMGDQVAYPIANNRYEEMKKNITNMITPRTIDQPTKIINRSNMAQEGYNYLL